MKLPHGRMLSACFLLALGVTLFTPIHAGAQFLPAEAQTYKREFGLSLAQAEQGLAVQHRAAKADIARRLEQNLGQHYAGLWFDHESGGFVVPLPAGAGRAKVDAEFQNAGLGEDFRIVAAKSNWISLEAAQDSIDEQLGDLIEGSLVQTSLDPRANAVVIHWAAGAAGPDHARLAKAAASQEVSVELRAEQADRFEARAAACRAVERICGKPLRGGVRIDPSDESEGPCTTAFKAIAGATGDRYMLTAGHCAPVGANRRSYDQFGVPHFIGPAEQSTFPSGDYAKLKVTGYGTWWEEGVSFWPSIIAYWGVSQEWGITGESSSYMGQQVCHSGISSGVSCGNVATLNKTVNYPEGTVYNLTEVAGGEFCAIPGDSGGPVFAGHTALGIFSGALELSCGGNLGYYAEITEATEALGVSVGSKIGAPPHAETGESVSAVQERQATVHGTIDPNGLSTSYHVQYGPTTSYGASSSTASAGSGWQPGSVNVTLQGLEPGVTYHYRLVASNSQGTSYGKDRQFTTVQPKPAVMVDDEGVTHVFFRAPNGQLEEWYESGEAWGQKIWGYADKVSGNPVALSTGGGSRWVYFRAPDGQLRSWWFKGSEWNETGWGFSGKVAGDPTAIVTSDGSRWVYFRAPDGQLRSWWFKGSEWNEMGWGFSGQLGGNPVALGTEDVRRVYFRASDGQLRQWWFKGSEWSETGWGYSNKVAGDPAPIAAADGSRWVYFRAPDGQLRSWWFKGSEWNETGWGFSGKVAGDPTAIVTSDGSRWVYFRAPDGQLRSWWFKGSEWNETGWGLSNAVGGDPTAIVAPSGRRDVYFLSPQGTLKRWWFSGSEWNLETIG